jgi:hypothetical protein
MSNFITLKIKRNEYKITADDEFMDDGLCIQLLTQSSWGSRYRPVLSKRAVKEIAIFERIKRSHRYGESVSVFSLVIPNIGEKDDE